MNSQLSLDESSDVPIYQQVVNRFEKAILTGEIKPGEYLPSVRELSMKHQVNPNTVSKAYQIIQSLGLVESIRGLGLRVMPVDHQFSDKRKKEILISSIDALFATGTSLQIPSDLLLQEIKARMKTHYHLNSKKNRELGRNHE
jgi:GntR family transcriptional regulator